MRGSKAGRGPSSDALTPTMARNLDDALEETSALEASPESLCEAAYYGNVDVVYKILASKEVPVDEKSSLVDVDTRETITISWVEKDERGRVIWKGRRVIQRTPLQWASLGGHLELCQLLLYAGANPAEYSVIEAMDDSDRHFSSKLHRTALHMVAKAGGVAHTTHDRDLSAGFEGSENNAAIFNLLLSALSTPLEESAFPFPEIYAPNPTLPHESAQAMVMGHLDAKFHTPVTLAIKSNNMSVFATLINFEHSYDLWGQTLKEAQSLSTHTFGDSTRALLAERVTMLYLAKYGRDRIFRLLMKHCKEELEDLDLSTGTHEVAYATRTGLTALHVAVRSSRGAMVRELLDHPKCQVNALTEDGASALTDALEKLVVLRDEFSNAKSRNVTQAERKKRAYRSHLFLVFDILQHGADVVYGLTSTKESPLYYAVNRSLGPVIQHPVFQAHVDRFWGHWRWKRIWSELPATPCFRFWVSALVYCFFLVCLTLVTLLGNTDIHTDAYYFSQSIKARTVHEEFYINPDNDDITKYFPEVDFILEIWTWIKGPFYSGIFRPYPYPTDFIMRYDKLVGNTVRLRQFRVRGDTCALADPDFDVLAANGECYGVYRAWSESTATFGPGKQDSSLPGWSYKDPTLGGGEFVSNLGVLFPESGGFVVDLDATNSTEVLRQLNFLEQNAWIDDQTRIVLLEFTIYNANINLFCVVRIQWDLPPNAVVFPSYDFFTVKLYRYRAPMDFVLLFFELVVLVMLVVYIGNEMREIITEGLGYWRYKWNYMDILLYLGFVVYLIFRFTSLGLLSTVDWDPDDQGYTNFQTVARYRKMENAMVGILIIIAWLKLFKFVRLQQAAGILINITAKMLRDFVAWLVLFFIIMVGFGLAFFIMMGTDLHNLRATFASCTAMFLTALGDTFYDEVEAEDEYVALGIYLMFIILASILLLNLLIAQLNQSYGEVINQATLEYLIDRARIILAYREDPAKTMAQMVGKNQAKALNEYRKSKAKHMRFLGTTKIGMSDPSSDEDGDDADGFAGAGAGAGGWASNASAAQASTANLIPMHPMRGASSASRRGGGGGGDGVTQRVSLAVPSRARDASASATSAATSEDTHGPTRRRRSRTRTGSRPPAMLGTSGLAVPTRGTSAGLAGSSTGTPQPPRRRLARSGPSSTHAFSEEEFHAALDNHSATLRASMSYQLGRMEERVVGKINTLLHELQDSEDLYFLGEEPRLPFEDTLKYAYNTGASIVRPCGTGVMRGHRLLRERRGNVFDDF